MANLWTVTIDGGAAKSFATLKLDEPDLTLNSQGADILTLVQRRKKTDATDTAQTFAYGATITIYRDAVQWFVGRVTGRRKSQSPRSEAINYTVAGAWWYFEKVVYNQIWKSWVSGTTFQNLYSSLVLLNLNTLGAKRTTGQQITDAINYAIAEAGIPVQLAAITLNFDVPIDEKQDITIAEVIRLMLRWHPDAVTWFDYSTSPPTFHVAKASELSTATVSFLGGKPNGGLDIVKRDDLFVPSVILKYRISGEFDGKSYRVIDEHKYPTLSTGRELGALCLTIDLEGANTSLVRGSIVTEPILPGSFAWWQNNNRKLSDENLDLLAIYDPLVVDSDGFIVFDLLPNKLITGQIANWMGFDKGKVIVSAFADYDYYDNDGNLIERVLGELVFVECTATDGETGDYSTVEDFTAGEPVPIGLETYLYNAINDTAIYEGTVTLRENEVTGLVTMGQRLNLSNSDPEFATMNAVVQSIRINIARGETTVTLGIPEHLSAGDLVELLRVNRVRRRFTLTQDRTEGSGGGGGEVDYPSDGANDNSDHSASQKTYFAVGDTDFFTEIDYENIYQENPTGSVFIAPVPGEDIMFRKFTLAVKNGSECSEVDVWLLASEV